MKVSSTQFSLEPVAKSEDFWRRVESLIQAAATDESVAICLPEYFAISYGLGLDQNGTFRDRLISFTRHLEGFKSRMQDLANQYRMMIVAGTVPVMKDGLLVNRCFVFRPRQPTLHQDKIHMTRFENEEWFVQSGARRVHTFQWQGTTCAVAICYDVEFPTVSMALAQAGVEVLFVPSCTDTEHGYWRVRHTAEARSIENQCFSVMSSIVAGDKRHPEIDAHFGQAVILSPCDGQFPAHGCLRAGQTNVEGQITELLKISELKVIRTQGAVLNFKDARHGHSEIQIVLES